MAYIDQRRSGQPESDAALVDRGRAGDHAALEQLFRRHAPAMNKLAFRLCLGPEDAEDLVQDAFAQAFDTLHRLEKPGAFGGWMRSILIRTAAKRARRRSVARRLGLAQTRDPGTVIATNAPQDVELELLRVYRALQKLPGEAGVALVLQRVEGMTLAQIAEHLGVSEPTVKRRIKRAVYALRERGEPA